MSTQGSTSTQSAPGGNGTSAQAVPEYQPVFSIIDKSLISADLAAEVYAQLEDSDIVIITREQLEDANAVRDKKRKDGKPPQGTKNASSAAAGAARKAQAGATTSNAPASARTTAGSGTGSGSLGSTSSRQLGSSAQNPGAAAVGSGATNADDDDSDEDQRFTLSDEMVERLKELVPKCIEEKLEEYLERKRIEQEREEQLRNPTASHTTTSSSGAKGKEADKKKATGSSAAVGTKQSGSTLQAAHAVSDAAVSVTSSANTIVKEKASDNNSSLTFEPLAKANAGGPVVDKESLMKDLKGLELVLGSNADLGVDGLPTAGPSIEASLDAIRKPNQIPLHIILYDVIRKPGDAQKLAAAGIELSAILILRFEDENGRVLTWNPNEASDAAEFGNGGSVAFVPQARAYSSSAQPGEALKGSTGSQIAPAASLSSTSASATAPVTLPGVPQTSQSALGAAGKSRGSTPTQGAARPTSGSVASKLSASSTLTKNQGTKNPQQSGMQSTIKPPAGDSEPDLASNALSSPSQLVQVPSFTPGVAVTSLSLRDAATAIFHIHDDDLNPDAKNQPFPTLPGELAMLVAADPRFRNVCCFYVRAVKPSEVMPGFPSAASGQAATGLISPTAGVTSSGGTAAGRPGGSASAKVKQSLPSPTAAGTKAASGNQTNSTGRKSGSGAAGASNSSAAALKEAAKPAESSSAGENSSASLDLTTAASMTTAEIRFALRQMAADRTTFAAWMHKVPAVAFPVLAPDTVVDTRVYNCLANQLPPTAMNDVSLLLMAMFEQVAATVAAAPRASSGQGALSSSVEDADYLFALPSGPSVGLTNQDPVDMMAKQSYEQSVAAHIDSTFASLLDSSLEASPDSFADPNASEVTSLLSRWDGMLVPSHRPTSAHKYRDQLTGSEDDNKPAFVLSQDDTIALNLVRAVLDGDSNALQAAKAYASGCGASSSSLTGLAKLYKEDARAKNSYLYVPGAGGRGLPTAAEKAASILTLSKAERGVALALLAKSTMLSADALERALITLAFEEMLARPVPDFSITQNTSKLGLSRIVPPCLAQGDPEIEDAVTFRIRELQKKRLLCQVGQGLSSQVSQADGKSKFEWISDVDGHIDAAEEMHESRFSWLALRSGVASRTLREPLTKSAMHMRLFDASFSVTDSVHTQARYFPLLDALLVAVQPRTPTHRQKKQDWRAFFCPNLNFSEWRAADQFIRSTKPQAVYKFNVPHTGVLARNATILYPCDQARLTRLHCESGRSKWTWLIVEKDDLVSMVEDVQVDCTLAETIPGLEQNGQAPPTVGFAAFADSAGMRAMLQAGKDSRVRKPVRTFTTQFEDSSRFFVTYDDDSNAPPTPTKAHKFKVCYTTADGVLSELHVSKHLILTPPAAFLPKTEKKAIYEPLAAKHPKAQSMAILPPLDTLKKVELPQDLREIRRVVGYSGIVTVGYENGAEYRLHPDGSVSMTRWFKRTALPEEILARAQDTGNSEVLVTIRTDTVGHTWIALAPHDAYDPEVALPNDFDSGDVGGPYSWFLTPTSSTLLGSTSQVAAASMVPTFLPRVGEFMVPTDAECDKQLCAVTYDPLTQARVFTRSDYTQFVLYSNGNSLAQHSDGTRIYRDVVARGGSMEANSSSAIYFIEQPHSRYPCVTISRVVTYQLNNVAKYSEEVNLESALERSESITVEVLAHDGTLMRGLPNGSVTLQRASGAYFVCSSPRERIPAETNPTDTSTVLSYAAMPTVDPRESLPQHIVYIPDDTIHATLRALRGDQKGGNPKQQQFDPFDVEFTADDQLQNVIMDSLDFDALVRGEIPRAFAKVSKGAYCVDMTAGTIISRDVENNDFLLELEPKNPKISTGAHVRLLRDVVYGETEEDSSATFSIPARYYMAPSHPLPARLFVLRASAGFENQTLTSDTGSIDLDSGVVTDEFSSNTLVVQGWDSQGVHSRPIPAPIVGYEILSRTQLTRYLRNVSSNPLCSLLPPEPIYLDSDQTKGALSDQPSLVTRRILTALRPSPQYRRVPSYSALVRAHIARYGDSTGSNRLFDNVKVYSLRQFLEAQPLDPQQVLLVWRGLEMSPSLLPSGFVYQQLELTNPDASVQFPANLDHIAGEFKLAALLTQQHRSLAQQAAAESKSSRHTVRLGIMGVELGDKIAAELEEELVGWSKRLEMPPQSTEEVSGLDGAAIAVSSDSEVQDEATAEQLQLLVLRARQKLAERQQAERQALAEQSFYSVADLRLSQLGTGSSSRNTVGIPGAGSLSQFSTTNEVLHTGQAELDVPVPSQTALSVFTAKPAAPCTTTIGLESHVDEPTTLDSASADAGWKSVGLGKHMYEKYRGIPAPNVVASKPQMSYFTDTSLTAREYRLRRLLLLLAQRCHPQCPPSGDASSKSAIAAAARRFKDISPNASFLDLEDSCIDAAIISDRKILARNVASLSQEELQTNEISFRDTLSSILHSLAVAFELISRVFSSPYDMALRTVDLTASGNGIWYRRVLASHPLMAAFLPALLIQVGYLPVVESRDTPQSPPEIETDPDPVLTCRVSLPNVGLVAANAFTKFVQSVNDDELRRILVRFRAQILNISRQFEVTPPAIFIGPNPYLGTHSPDDGQRASAVASNILATQDEAARHTQGSPGQPSWHVRDTEAMVYNRFAGEHRSDSTLSKAPRLQPITLASGGVDPETGDFIVHRADDGHLSTPGARQAAAATAEGRALLLLSDSARSGAEDPSDDEAGSDPAHEIADKEWIPVSMYDTAEGLTAKPNPDPETAARKQKLEAKLRATALEPVEHAPRGQSFRTEPPPPLTASSTNAAMQALRIAAQAVAGPTQRPPLASREHGVTGSPRSPTSVVPIPPIYGPSAESKPYAYYYGTKSAPKTASTFTLSSVGALAPGLPTCTLLPAVADFGTCQEGVTYRLTLALTNTGSTMARFQVGQPVVPNDALYVLRALYRPGAIAAGMTKHIELELYASKPGTVESGFSVITEREVFEVPITARVLSQTEFADSNPNTATSANAFVKSMKTKTLGSTASLNTTLNATRPSPMLSQAGATATLGSTFKVHPESPRVKQSVAQVRQLRKEILEMSGPALSPPGVGAEDTTYSNSTAKFGKLGQPRAISDRPSEITAKYLEQILAQQEEEAARQNVRQRALELRDAEHRKDLERQDDARRARAEAIEALRSGKSPLTTLSK